MRNNNEPLSAHLRRTHAVSMLLPITLLVGGCDAKNGSTTATVEPSSAGVEQVVSPQEKKLATADQVVSQQPQETAATTEQMHLGKNVFRACAACYQFDGQGVPGKYLIASQRGTRRDSAQPHA